MTPALIGILVGALVGALVGVVLSRVLARRAIEGEVRAWVRAALPAIPYREVYVCHGQSLAYGDVRGRLQVAREQGQDADAALRGLEIYASLSQHRNAETSQALVDVAMMAQDEEAADGA